MLYPAMSELLKHIDSRYLMVNVVARRARQISIESETHSAGRQACDAGDPRGRRGQAGRKGSRVIARP